jgi:adenylate cyclase
MSRDLAAAEAEIVAWLIDAGLTADDMGVVLEELAQRLRRAGLPLARLTLGSDLLHPVLDSRGFRWHHETGSTREEFSREAWAAHEEAWQRSPLFALLESRKKLLRRRLDGDYQKGEFPILDELKAQGFTDYIAFVVKFGPTVSFGEQVGVIGTFAADRPGGFTAAEAELLQRLMPAFGLAFKSIDSVHTTRVLMSTYLGDDPAERVLRGDIARGVAESVDVVLWYSQLAGFTQIADSVPRDGMMLRFSGYTGLMSLLNDYTDGLVTVIRDHGGEVLKFVGDGILAKFKHDGDAAACDVALDAAASALAEVDRITASRAAEGVPVTDVNLALHAGEVLYGNIGSRDRLDFTVIGPAVNEVMRIEAMCRTLDQRLIVSAAFARAAGPARERLVSLGRFALPGVRRPDELFTLDPEHAAAAPRAA